jgi:serine/threonine protein phosphatase PrpC
LSHVGKTYKWRTIQQSVRGASHKRLQLPNQDAIGAWQPQDDLAPVVMAVSDGHGSAKSFRSDVGAQLAAEVTLAICRDFLERVGDSAPSVVKQFAEQQLPSRLVACWKQKVDEHFRDKPFSDAELDRLEGEAGPTARRTAMAEGKHLTAYGATLLVVMVTDSFVVYLQLGDGDIVTVSESTGDASWVLPRDVELIANETYSLCLDNAVSSFRIRFQRISDSLPSLFLVATDGYVNSFEDESGFLKAGSDILELLHTQGIDGVERDLPNWLDEASGAGSGDDITVGLIYRIIGVNTAQSSSLRADLEKHPVLPQSHSKTPEPPVAPVPTEPPAEEPNSASPSTVNSPGGSSVCAVPNAPQGGRASADAPLTSRDASSTHVDRVELTPEPPPAVGVGTGIGNASARCPVIGASATERSPDDGRDKTIGHSLFAWAIGKLPLPGCSKD